MAFGFFKKKETAPQQSEQDPTDLQARWDSLTKQKNEYIAAQDREAEKTRREDEEINTMIGAGLMRASRISQRRLDLNTETAAQVAKESGLETRETKPNHEAMEITPSEEYEVFTDAQLEKNLPRLKSIEDRIKSGSKDLTEDDIIFIMTSDDNNRRVGAPEDYKRHYSDNVRDFIARRNELKTWCFNNLNLDGMNYSGDLDLAGINTLNTLPNNLHVKGQISLHKTPLTKLPEGLHADTAWLDGTDISSIPASTRIDNILSVYNTKVQISQIPTSVRPKKIYSPTEMGVSYDGTTRERL